MSELFELLLDGFEEFAEATNNEHLKNVVQEEREKHTNELNEDTVKQGNKWVNKGDSGKTHGKFNTKKQADAQRKAMYANNFKGESLEEKLEKGTKVKLNKAAWHKDQSKVGTVKGNIGETYWIEWPDGEVTQEIKGYLDIVNEDIDSTLAARERRDRIEYLKNQIKEETKDWQTKFGDKGSVDIFKENDKKLRYAISPFIRHDDGESLDVIEKTFKEIIRKTNKYFNLEGTEKFRLKLNPMFVTIICP